MKKKILAIVLCVAMLAIAIVGGTMAYFTDTKAQTNTFTTGNVSIKLDEVVVQKVEDSTKDTYGDLVAKGDGSRTEDDQDYGKLYPGQKIAKDPTITNTGSEDAYIAAKITVTMGTEGMVLGAVHLAAIRDRANQVGFAAIVFLTKLAPEVDLDAIVFLADFALLMLGSAIGLATDGTGCFFLIQGQHAALDIF